MARKPGMARGTVSVARCIHCCPNFFFLPFAPPASPYRAEYMCVHIWLRTDCIWITVATKWQCSEIFLHKSERAKCWLDIYRWGTGLAVTGRIRDIGQHVLQSAFGSNRSPIYCHIFYLIAYLEGAFIRNKIILQCSKLYNIILICTNNINAIISNNCWRLQDLMLLFKIFIRRQFEHAPLKRFAALLYT
jgi:hypothetical protein